MVVVTEDLLDVIKRIHKSDQRMRNGVRVREYKTAKRRKEEGEFEERREKGKQRKGI